MEGQGEGIKEGKGDRERDGGSGDGAYLCIPLGYIHIMHTVLFVLIFPKCSTQLPFIIFIRCP